MKRKKKHSRAGKILGGILILLGMLAGLGQGKDGKKERIPDGQMLPMEVHFIDVGQADATLVICGEQAMLIDAAEDSQGTFLQNYLRKQGVTKLDYLILTHPDADHIGAAPVILTKFPTEQVFVSDFEKDNRTYRKLIQALDDRRITAVTPKPGEQFELGSAVFTILAPNQTYENPNDASIALLLQNGSSRFLFTGDAESRAETDILDSGLDIKTDVYQAGHHGSRNSSSEAFLDAADPAYVVISCGIDNSYGHPHAEVLNNLRRRGCKVFRTDEQGSVIARTDGTDITWNCAPSESWKAGEPTGSAAAEDVTETGVESTAESGTVAGAESAAETAPEGEAVPGGNSADQTSQEAVTAPEPEVPQDSNTLSYVLNVRTKKFHRPNCGSLPTANRQDTAASREEVIAQGYVPCKKCNP